MYTIQNEYTEVRAYMMHTCRIFLSPASPKLLIKLIKNILNEVSQNFTVMSVLACKRLQRNERLSNHGSSSGQVHGVSDVLRSPLC